MVARDNSSFGVFIVWSLGWVVVYSLPPKYYSRLGLSLILSITAFLCLVLVCGAFCVFYAFDKISLEAMANRSPVFLVIGAAIVAAVVDLAVVGVLHCVSFYSRVVVSSLPLSYTRDSWGQA